MTMAGGGRALLSQPKFVLFVAARGSSVFGTQLLAVAVGWDVYTTWGDVLDLGLIGLAQFLPALGLFLVAGMAADRLDRSHIMTACGLVELGTTIAIGVQFLAGPRVLWPVLLLLAVHGGARAFFQPASQALLPQIVPQERFARAVALVSTVTKFSQLGGPALGGLLLAYFGTGTYWIGAALFAVAALSALLIRPTTAARSRPARGLRAILGGLAYILEKKTLLGIITIDLVAVLFGGVMGLLPVYAVDVLHVGPDMLGLMRAMPAAGAMLVAIYLARTHVSASFGRLMFVALAIFGASIVVFGLSSSLWLSLAALAVYGASDMVSVFVRQTLVQTETPDELRGRVSAVNAVSINASNELGDFRAGTMAAALGTVPAVVLGGIVTLSAVVAWWQIFPGIRTARVGAAT